ncbi:MAG: NfeD family protein [Pseudomonadota bacterium]
MKKYFKFLFCTFLIIFSLNLIKHSYAQNSQEVFYLIKVDGMIDRGLLPFIKRTIQVAQEEGAKGLIFDINTFGGRLDAAVEIRDAIMDTKLTTIAFINPRAISAGALISIACDKIAMTSGGTIGAATPIMTGPSQEAKPVGEKMVSYFRSEMRATAEKKGRDPKIAEAMVDSDVEIKDVIEKEKLLTLTTQDAIKIKFIDTIAETKQEVLTNLGFENGIIKENKTNWAEEFIRFITHPLVSSLLMSIGFLGLFLEFKTAGWGIAGTAGTIALILFFFGHYTINLVGWEEILLFLLGVALLLAEIFFIPGFGIAGISGIFCVVISLILSLMDTKFPVSMPDISAAFLQVGFAVIFTFIGMLLIIKYFPKTGFGKRLVLQAGILSRNADKAKDLDNQNMEIEGIEAIEVGDIGRAKTILRPAGTAIFNKKKYSVVTEGDFIEEGSEIELIKIEGTKFVVRKRRINNV